jgi:hypothetical protein
MYFKIAPIPAAHTSIFQNGIDHPDLWLWDSWTLQETKGDLHLYCLALSKTHSDGTQILPPDRNDFTFHVRRFISEDGGSSWRDHGAVMHPKQMKDGSDARNVWSGSVLRLDEGSVAFGYTGVRDSGSERRFLQTICIATGPSPAASTSWPEAALSCPLRDYDAICDKGYYLGPRDSLGSNAGEDGGPIMAWRDPYLFTDTEGELFAVWSAKVSANEPAIALARLERRGSGIELVELCAPIRLPDAHLMTQAEVPKIYRDRASGDFLLMVSACDRQYEGQPDEELTHIHRLYRSATLDGPWRTYAGGDSALPGLEGLFGASLLDIDLSAGHFTALGPYTENAGPEKQLRFEKPIRNEFTDRIRTSFAASA